MTYTILHDEFLDEFNRRSDQLRAWYDCDHEGRIELRRRVMSNGTIQLWNQCTHCGAQRGATKKVGFSQREIDALPPYDDTLAEERYQEQRGKLDSLREEIGRVQERKRTERDTEWWRWYNGYLRSPEWQRKRVAVLRRARSTCEGCGQHPATQVHHLTYDRVGDEMLFDLVAICENCHSKLHTQQEAETA